MEWLNYHHLFYFWTVARDKTIAKASHALRLARATVSEQIRSLEDSLGVKLFEKEGRGLVLTEAGRVFPASVFCPKTGRHANRHAAASVNVHVRI